MSTAFNFCARYQLMTVSDKKLTLQHYRTVFNCPLLVNFWGNIILSRALKRQIRAFGFTKIHPTHQAISDKDQPGVAIKVKTKK